MEDLRGKINKLKLDLTKSSQLANRLQSEKETSERILQAQKGAAKRNNMITESLQRELQQLQQATARKSAAAQKLIQEREVECAELRVTNKKLQQEVDKGSLS